MDSSIGIGRHLQGGPWLLSEHVSCSLSVVAYMGRRLNVSILNVSRGSYIKMLGLSTGILQMVFCESNEQFVWFLMLGTKKVVVECVFNAWANYDVENFNVLLQGRRGVEYCGALFLYFTCDDFFLEGPFEEGIILMLR